MAPVSHLRALQALELAIRKGSLKAAARELAISPAALGQRIRALEDYLGYDLLVRGRSGIRPTGELDAAIAHLAAGFRELETVSRLLDFQRASEIHIAADSDWAELWLAPRLASFRQRHPSILFCINGVGDVPLRLGAADIDVRFARAARGTESIALFRDYLVPVSSPANTARVSGLPREVRLEGFPLLHLDCYADAGCGWPEWIAQYGYRKTAPELGIRYGKVQHALEAVYADAGFILCGLALVQAMIDDGRLDAPFPLAEGSWTQPAYRVTVMPHAAERPAVTAFCDWLAGEAGSTRDALLQALSG